MEIILVWRKLWGFPLLVVFDRSNFILKSMLNGTFLSIAVAIFAVDGAGDSCWGKMQCGGKGWCVKVLLGEWKCSNDNCWEFSHMKEHILWKFYDCWWGTSFVPVNSNNLPNNVFVNNNKKKVIQFLFTMKNLCYLFQKQREMLLGREREWKNNSRPRKNIWEQF